MGESRVRVVVFAGLAVMAVSIGMLAGRLGHQTPPAVPSTASLETNAIVETGLRVHVSGMVIAPGVVEIPEGSIVADAIEAAGGLRPEAVVDQINLAAPVSAGDQIVVPGPGTSDKGAVAGDGVISLNRSGVGELEELPGVGPVLAERIVAFREEGGGFETVEDLLQVPGIGEAKLAAIRDLVEP